MFLRGLALRGKARSRILSLHGRADGRRNLFYLIRNLNAHTSDFWLSYLIISFSSCFPFSSQLSYSQIVIRDRPLHKSQAASFYKTSPFTLSNMTTTSMIQPKFLTKGDELGVVAVGFSGGQVSKPLVCTCKSNPHSANQELMQHHQL
jgi:hypothetical protein